MEKGKKAVLSILSLFSGVIPLKLLTMLTLQRNILPFYHAVSDSSILHIKHLYDVRTFKDFKADIEYLLGHYTPVSISDLSKIVAEKSGNQYMFLSFDDGLREVKDFIAPYLFEKGVPAHIFLNSAFLNNRQLMFRYKISLIIESLSKVTDYKIQRKILEIINGKGSVQANLRTALLKLQYHQTSLIDEIADFLELDFKDYLDKNKPYLSSSDVKELMKKGFTFGSHSIDHPEFQYINSEQQIYQTHESIKALEYEFDIPVRSFAFPFTDHNVKKDYFDRIKQLNIVDYTFGGAGIKNEVIDFHFQRMPMEAYHGRVRRIIHTEYLYYLLKMPFGKNLIKR